MVSENYTDPPVDQLISRNGSASSVTVPSGVSKSQYGYRSRSLSASEEAALGNASKEANIVSLLNAYDEIGYEYFAKPNRAFLVNDRDYSEYRYAPGTFSYQVQMRYPDDPAYRYSVVGQMAVISANPIFPDLPSVPTLTSMASGMMRRAVPTKSEIDLVRFIAEQKDAPLLFRAANYAPRSPREAAGAFLNYVFGVKPTISDLSRISETIVSWDATLRQFIRQEKMRIRRKGSKELWSSGGSGTVSSQGPQMFGARVTLPYGPMSVTQSYVLPGSYTGSNNTVAPSIHWSWKGSQTITMFATFEYFIPKPASIGGRLSRYSQLAKRVLGGGFTPSTVYDLTPWTWMVDWFVDVGGLLRYQQSVADNQVTASSSGYSIWESWEGQVAYLGMYPHRLPNSVGMWRVYSVDFNPGIATFSVRKHTRRKGGPYSMSPTWDLSQQQWAITGALGLSRSPGVPNIRS